MDVSSFVICPSRYNKLKKSNKKIIFDVSCNEINTEGERHWFCLNDRNARITRLDCIGHPLRWGVGVHAYELRGEVMFESFPLYSITYMDVDEGEVTVFYTSYENMRRFKKRCIHNSKCSDVSDIKRFYLNPTSWKTSIWKY